MKPVYVLVDRLVKHYNPFGPLFGDHVVFEPIEALIRKTRPSYCEKRERPVKPYLHETETAYQRRRFHWDKSRVHFFIKVAEAQVPFDKSISVDWYWNGNVPTSLTLLDGHHRLCAAVIAKKQLIEVDYGGPVDFLRYLKGELKKEPVW